MELLYIILALATGAVIGYLLGKAKLGKALFERDTFEKEVERLRVINTELESNKLEVARLQEKLEGLKLLSDNENERFASEKAELLQRSSLEKEELQKRYALEKEEREKEYTKTVEQLRQNFVDTKADLEKQWKEKAELMKSEFQSLANEVLKKQSNELNEVSKKGWEELMTPLQEKMTAFEKAVQENKEKSVENTATLESSIKHLMERSKEIGSEAEKLTKALKGDSKIQGDWGEMVLERLLEMSGLRKDEEYFVQMNVESTAAEGTRMRPDVVVRFPEGRSVVIDSKVSLTAYVDYMSSEDDAERAIHLKKHLDSIRKHVEELSNKDYSKVVKDAIGYVLMFVPNEASYILAVKSDETLSTNAYKKRIIIISPTNLIMALQLAYMLWQGDRQNKNVEEIIRRANALYEKFATFSGTFMDIGNSICRLQEKFEDGTKQLTSGKGNLTKQFEELKRLGLNPKKGTDAKLLEQMEE